MSDGGKSTDSDVQQREVTGGCTGQQLWNLQPAANGS